MGFFGKLFEKKECAICGGEIGLLGNRKLEDGNMCKHCAAKLSPWFSERRHSTIAEITEQLEYREQNRAKLNGFQVSKCFGDYYRMYVEEKQGVPTRFVVSGDSDYRDENADLIDFKDVSHCSIDIREHHRELTYTNDQNERVSYNPRRYEYEYDFHVELGIQNNPYFDEIKFRLNRSSVEIITEQYGTGLGQLLMGSREFDPGYNPEYREYKKMCDEIEEIVAAGQKGTPIVRLEDALVNALNALAGNGGAAAAPAQEAPRAKFCPECGAPVSGGKFCQHCGSKL